MPRAFPHRGVLSLTRRTLAPYLVLIGLVLPTGVSTAATYAGNATSTAAPTVVTGGTVGEVTTKSYLLEVRPAVRKQVRRINRARERNGLDPVRLHRCLTDEAAQPWARRMAKTGDFRHQELTDVQKNCTRFGWFGENIAYGYPTAATVMEAWMDSSGHRANILRPQFTHVGIGVRRDASGRRYWVQNFGG